MAKPKTNMTTGRRLVRRLALGAVLMLALAGPAAAQNAKTYVMKMSTATLNDAQHEWMKRFAVEIEKVTNGRIKAEVYPASQLGSIPRQIEGTQLGAIQAWVGPPEFLVGVDPRFEILSAPGLFQNDQQALALFSDEKFVKAFLSLGANKGLVGAALFFTGPMAVAFRTPVHTLAEFKDKKVRVLASPFQIEQMTRLGATGVPLTLGDVVPALQQGAIDGAMSAVGVMTALHYYDAAKYLNETRQSYIYSIAMLSKQWFDALPADLQAAVMTTSKKIASEVVPWDMDFLDQQRKVWVDKGGQVIPLSAADEKELMQKMRPIGDDIVKTKPELKPLWDMLVASVKRDQ